MSSGAHFNALISLSTAMTSRSSLHCLANVGSYVRAACMLHSISEESAKSIGLRACIPRDNSDSEIMCIDFLSE
jgi:hypothetical protein